MGGKGSGGSRVGAGRKPWKHAARVVTGGDAGQGGSASQSASAPAVAPAAAAAKVMRPKLVPAVRAVWDALAPQATEQGTLVQATAFEFRVMCELVVEHRECLKALQKEKFTQLGLKIGAHYRGLTQRLETKMRAFKLAPMGKEIAPPAKDKPLTALERLKLKRQNLHAVK